jgi:hypothetical protein
MPSSAENGRDDGSLSFTVDFVILSCNGLFEEARLFCPDSLEMRAPDETA